MSKIADFREVCEEAARTGGQVLREHRGRVSAREKQPADIVTEADIASQRAVRDVLLGAFPQHGFLAEENESIPPGSDGLRWIVDPLDGTVNFFHGIPHYCVSVGLEQRGKLLVGVVYDPVTDECYAASAGSGATLNGEPLKVSTATELGSSVVAVSLPPLVRRDSPAMLQYFEVLERCRATRRTGSVALNLCALAAGRFDAFWSYCSKPWDVAAGVLIATEAGGTLTGPSGSEFDLETARFVAAATPALHAQLCEVLALAPI